MDVEGVFERIGGCGRQQKVYTVIIFLVNFVSAFQHVLLVFVGDIPKATEFYCVQSTEEGGSLAFRAKMNRSMEKTCEEFKRGECSQFIYLSHWKSIPIEMNLVCGEAYKVSFSQSVYMSGVLVGALVFGMVSDSIGRLKTCYVTAALILVTSFALGFSPTFEVFATLRFLIGFGVSGLALSAYVLGSELIGGEYRAIYVILNSFFFALGICILTGLAYMVVDWRQLSNVVAVVSLVIFLLFFKLPESPRWLLSQGKVKEAQKVLRSIAKGNGLSDMSEDSFDLKVPVSEKTESQDGGSSEGLGSLVRHWLICKWTLLQIYSWFANSAVYYGLTMASGALSGNLYLSALLSGVAELPAYSLLLILQGRVGRKVLVSGSMIIGGVSCLSIVFLSPHQVALKTGLALVGKMGISASFASIYLHSTELFPTVIRNAALGIVSMSARVGGVIAPFITIVGTFYPSQEFVIFGAICLSSGLLNLQLPETKGKPLPETLNDVLSLQTHSKFNRRPRLDKIGDSSSISTLLQSRNRSPEKHII